MSSTINQQLAQNQAAGLVRLVIGLVMAMAVTLSLFWLMQYLIETADRTLNDDGAGNLVAPGFGEHVAQTVKAQEATTTG